MVFYVINIDLPTTLVSKSMVIKSYGSLFSYARVATLLSAYDSYDIKGSL